MEAVLLWKVGHNNLETIVKMKLCLIFCKYESYEK